MTELVVGRPLMRGSREHQLAYARALALDGRNVNFEQNVHGLADFEIWQTARRLSRQTINERVRVIARFAAETGVQPISAEAIDIVRWIASHADDWAESSSATYQSYLNSWYRWLQLTDRRLDNPMIKVGTPKVPEREPRPVSDRGLIKLLQARMRHKTRVMILLAALAGLRVHEIAKIRGEDIDHDAGLLWVTGKGRKRKSIPLHPLLREVASEMPPSGYWFPNRDYEGVPVLAKSVSDIISRTMKRARVRGTPHSLRHWYGTTLLDEGADLRVVQELLRHKSIASTQFYTAVPPNRRRAAIETLDVMRGVRRSGAAAA